MKIIALTTNNSILRAFTKDFSENQESFEQSLLFPMVADSIEKNDEDNSFTIIYNGQARRTKPNSKMKEIFEV